jgi:NADPH:quinone reductase-like Zn-dependent oxidoreductase
MKQIVITAHGGPEKLAIQEAPDPAPGPGTVRIRVTASGINFADILARRGLYPDAPKPPAVVGYEVAGAIDALGPGVSGFRGGERVFALTRFGGYSDVVVVPVDQVFECPPSLTPEQCAAIPVNYLTAWQLLIVMGSLAKDETVLIHNAGGGVGLAAIDIARHIGARIIGTASAGKHAFLAERGCHAAIDYRTQDWAVAVAELTQGRGVELILDPLGGKHWKKSWKALRSTGRLGMFGISVATESRLLGPLRWLPLAAGMPLFHPVALMNRNRSAFGVNLGHMWHEPAKIRVWMEALLQGVKDAWVRPHVDKAFSFARAGDAHSHLEARRNVGKVVLTPYNAGP